MDPVAEFLSERYRPGARLVEVGVGNRTGTADALRAEGYDVITTDVKGVEGAVRDDVFDPDPGVYEGAAAIYLVRPGEEMQAAALRLARDVGADLVVRPLGDEVLGEGDPELFNVRGTPLYVWSR